MAGNKVKRNRAAKAATSVEVFVYTGPDCSVPKDVISVQFHPSLVKVADRAFAHCSKLKEVIFNEGLQMICESAFSPCISLESIVLPSTVTEIGRNAFSSCYNLRELVLNDGLQKIMFGAFQHCTSLESIMLPSSLTWAPGAFFGCKNLQNVVLNEGITEVWGESFSVCKSLESITIPSTVTEIEGSAFSYCHQLKEVILKEGLLKIGSFAFHNCKALPSITIPSVTEIDNTTFLGCKSLSEVILQGIQYNWVHAFFECESVEVFMFPTMSSRLNAIIRAGHWKEIENKVNEIRGAMEKRNGELCMPASAMRRGWIRGYGNEVVCKMEKLISHYEMKDATSMFELALWKSKLHQAGSNVENRSDYRVEVPGPVKETILGYFYS